MSVTIENKIELFSKMILGNIEANSSAKRQKLIEAHNKELESLRLEVEKRKKELVETAAERAERERTKLIAQAQNQQQHLQTAQKQRAMLKAVEKLHELAASYTGTQDYKKYMKKNIESALKSLENSKNITFYVMEKDIQQCREILYEISSNTAMGVKFDVKKVSDNMIGGVIAEDMDNLLQLDLTLKALIEEHKDIVGASITRRFNEVNNQ